MLSDPADYNLPMDIMETYARMVDFLGKACGENCEVVLQDLREGKNRILAIANGHISGRAAGDPVTGLSLRLVQQGVWKTRDYFCNHEGKTAGSPCLRSSVFFIKDGGKLLGMLSVNIDAEKFIAASEQILSLAGLRPVPVKTPPPPSENFHDNMEEIITSVFKELGLEQAAAGPFQAEERLRIIEKLMDHEIFLLRGSVSRVAEMLKCSEASMYRYIAMINKRRSHAG